MECSPCQHRVRHCNFFLRLGSDGHFFLRLGSVGGVVFGGVFPTEPTGAISVGSGYRDQDTQPGTETHH